MAEAVERKNARIILVSENCSPQVIISSLPALVGLLILLHFYLRYLDSSVSPEGFIIAIAVYLLLTFIAAMILIANRFVVIDLSASTVETYWKFGLSFFRRRYLLENFQAVVLCHEIYRDHTGALIYFPIRLLHKGGFAIEVDEENQLYKARKRAAEIASQSGIPFEDLTLSLTEKLLPRDVPEALGKLGKQPADIPRMRSIHLSTAVFVMIVAAALLGLLIHTFRIRSVLFLPLLVAASPLLYGIAYYFERRILNSRSHKS